jgi:hypothetical protein
MPSIIKILHLKNSFGIVMKFLKMISSSILASWKEISPYAVTEKMYVSIPACCQTPGGFTTKITLICAGWGGGSRRDSCP